MTEPRAITLPDGHAVSAVRTEATGPDTGWTFVYAPGAGSNIHDPFGAFASRELTARGIEVIRFQFPYQEAGKRAPDRTPVLEGTWRAIIDAVRPEAGRLAVGGRSMGGRIASQVVAQGVGVDALVLFAYPLHPPGKPDQLRDAHLPSITTPTLFCSGTNDAFATPEELHKAAALVPGGSVHLLAAADHGFAAPRASGRARQDVWQEAADTLAPWLLELPHA